MNRERPVSVLVLAILHFVGGGLGLIVVLCAGFGLVMQANMARMPGAQQDLGSRLQQHLQQQVPAKQAADIGDVVLRLVLAFMLLAAGVGLLMMKPWGRYLSLVYAGLSILEKLVLLFVQFALVWPVADRFLQNEPQAQQPGFMTGFKITLFGAAFIQTAFIIYPIVVIILLCLPSVREAFSARPRRRDEDDEEDWDDRDWRSRRDEEDEDDRRPGRYR